MSLTPAHPRRHYAAAQAARQPYARGAVADAPSSAPVPAKAWPENRVPVPVLALGAAAPAAASGSALPSLPVSTPASGALRNAADAAAAYSALGLPRGGMQNGGGGMRLAAGSPCEGGVALGHGTHPAAVSAMCSGGDAEACESVDREHRNGVSVQPSNGRLDSARDHSSGGAGPDSTDPMGNMYPGGMAYACLPPAPLGHASVAAVASARAAPGEGQGLGPRGMAPGRDGFVQRGDSSMLDSMEAGWHGAPKGQGVSPGSGSACTCGGPGARCACGGPARGGCADSAGAAPLQYKRLPVLTWWLETACALGGVLLLPLLSLTPCSTSAVRADAVCACSG